MTERDYFGYWITVPYVQGTLIGDMYKNGPQQYNPSQDGGNQSASTELPASRLDSELLRGGLVLKRRPYDPLNEQFNDYNPYRTAGEFKPREDSELIVEDRARPDEVQLLMQNPVSYQTDPNAAQLVSPLADIGMLKACFAGDTLVPTPNGYKPIGQFAVGDEVYSRHELNPNGETVVVRIDKVFRRMGNIPQSQAAQRSRPRKSAPCLFRTARPPLRPFRCKSFCTWENSSTSTIASCSPAWTSSL